MKSPGLTERGGGRRNSFSLLELTDRVQKTTKIKIPIGSIADNRPSDIRIYITDNSYSYKETGWCPKKNLEHIIEDTHLWMDEYYDELRPIFA